jgi:hypothetical protein
MKGDQKSLFVVYGNIPPWMLSMVWEEAKLIFCEISLILEDSQLSNACHQVFSINYGWHSPCIK